jgi:Zn-dependent M28 family amino/carboxypeptidase
MDDAAAESDLAVAALSARFGAQSDVTRVTADVASVARSPRGRRHHPEQMAAAEDYVTARLTEAGWTITAAPFERRWVIGVSDAGGRVSIVRRLRFYPRLRGVNLLADLPGSPPGRRVLVVAHLDSVACSPGADDNASGVAALIECARLLASLPDPPAVTLAVVDLEELGKVGSTALARDRAYLRTLKAVICLESVGTFCSQPGTQRLGGLGLLFRDVAGRVRVNQSRGDFVLAVCRTSSSRAAQVLAAGGAALSPPLAVLAARDPRADGWRGRLVTWLFPLLANLDRSDHAPFWNRGVPSMLVSTTAPFRNRHYHLPGDRPENLDYPRLTALAAAVAATAATWSD